MEAHNKIRAGLEKFLMNKIAEQFGKTLEPMSMEQFNREIDQSMKDSDEGRIISARDLKEKYIIFYWLFLKLLKKERYRKIWRNLEIVH